MFTSLSLIFTLLFYKLIIVHGFIVEKGVQKRKLTASSRSRSNCIRFWWVHFRSYADIEY